MSAPTPRFPLPRGYILSYTQLAKPVRPQQIAYRTLPICRHASASTSKPRVLEKPTKFNPPSHGKRLKQHVPRRYGPQLTWEQKTEQQRKKYPNMMPPPGTFMHWFLTSRGIHTFISLVSSYLNNYSHRPKLNYSSQYAILNPLYQGVLVLLACITAFENWRLATTFREQLPAASDFLTQPLTAFWQLIDVYQLEVAKTSAETAQKRKRNVEDVQKRSTYRIAHGLENENSQGLGGWTARSDEESLGPGAVGRPVGFEPGQPFEPEGVVKDKYSRERPVHEREGRRKPVKKWLGIWE